MSRWVRAALVAALVLGASAATAWAEEEGRLVLGASAATAWAEEEGEHEGGPFGAPLAVPALAAGLTFEQDPPLPENCDLPPHDANFKALGTHPGPPAVAHHAGGRVIETNGPTPFPQVFPTGDIAIEPNIGVTPSGAVFVDVLRCGQGSPAVYQPTVLRSTDQGQSWRDVSPSLSGQPSHPFTEDPYLYVDKRTGRLFSTDIDTVVACEPLSISDDAGKAWTESQIGCGLADHANIFAGPPPADGAQPSGYPDVVYYCAIDGGAMAGASKATGCQKSLDGGVTSMRTGEPPFVADPAISAQNPVQCDGGTGPGFVDSRGTVYDPRGWCGQPYLAISHDEGASWDRVQVSKLGMGTQNDDKTVNQTFYNHEAGVRVDSHGTIYYVWVAHDRLPYLVVSHDAGKTWSAPKMFGPPGVRQAWNPTIDIAPSGRIAMSYMASTNAPGAPFADGPEDHNRYKDTTYNGYITISDDPDSSDPTFYTASVNDPSRPFLKFIASDSSTAAQPCSQVRCGQEYDFFDLKFARDGTPWAIYIDACGTGKDCISAGFGEAVAARMVIPGTEAALNAASGALLGRAPRKRTCASRRHFRIHVHRPRFVRLTSARVYVNGHRVAVRRGRRLTAPIDLRGLPRGRFTVTIKARTSTGRTITAKRRYRTCVPKPG